MALLLPPDAYSTHSTDTPTTQSGRPESGRQHIKTVGALAPTPRADRHDDKFTGRVALRPRHQLLKQVKIFCIANNLTLTEFFERAATDYMQAALTDQAHVGALAPTDRLEDRYINQEIEFIVSLFQNWTRPYNAWIDPTAPTKRLPWTPNDNAAAVRLKDYGPVLIELAMIQTLLRKPITTGQIKTFRYYVPQIHETAKTQGHMKASTLEFQRDHYAAKLRGQING